MGLSHEHILDPATAALIRRKARRIVERCHLSRSDYRDLQQDLYVRLLRRAPLYDGRRSEPYVFIAIVLRSGVSNLIKRHFAQYRDGGGCAQLGEEDEDLADPRRSDVCLRLDVHRALSSLDPQHRALATALETYKLVPAGRACGLTRGLARKGLAYLRHHFTACGLAPDALQPLRRAS